MSRREAHKAAPQHSSVLAYARLRLLLLHAAVEPGKLAPPGYADAVFRLWADLLAVRWVPSVEEFDRELRDLYALLRAVGLPNGAFVGGEQGDALLTAKRWLDEVSAEAYRLGLATLS